MQPIIKTNVTMPEVLEAAHIKPFKYKGEDCVFLDETTPYLSVRRAWRTEHTFYQWGTA